MASIGSPSETALNRAKWGLLVMCGRGAQVLAALRPLLPRLYSISSSMLEGQRSVQITVATVRYESLGRPRIGVTSTYLAERLKVLPP